MSTDFLNLNEHKIFQKLRDSLPKSTSKTINVLTVKDNVLFAWDFQDHCVLTINVKAARSKQGDNVFYQKLLPLTPPLFSPELIAANDYGNLLIVAGSGGVLVFELPSKCPPYGAFDNNKELVYCRSYSLDERLLAFNEEIEVVQVKFHPGSVKDNHILLLTSDNTLRLYVIENSTLALRGVYPVGPKPCAKLPCSRITFLDALGETAVDFDFGLPELSETPEFGNLSTQTDLNDSLASLEISLRNASIETIPSSTPLRPRKRTKSNSKEQKKLRWPVYVLSADGLIFTISIPLYSKSTPVVKGPIPCSPSEIFKTTKRACSIICLNSNPQVICVGNSNGEIFHGIVLPTEDDAPELIKHMSGKFADRPDKEITFLECVEIELGLPTTELPAEDTYTCPIYLHKDESRADRYFATHACGVHSVSIPFVDGFKQFASSKTEDDEDLISNDLFSNSSIVEYLICTKTTSSKEINPLIGFAPYYDPSAVLAFLANGKLISLALVSPIALPKMDEPSIKEEKPEIKSPVKEMLREPFDQLIQKLLKKAGSQPILQLSNLKDQSPMQCFELLQMAAQMFRENHFKYHTMAKEEIEKRVQALIMLKEYQLKELDNLLQERQKLQSNAENLAEKYEDIKDKQDWLMKRCENLLLSISQKKTDLSDAEVDYIGELKKSKEQMERYSKAIDKLQTKRSYQEMQMRAWKAEQAKKTTSIGETHIKTIKANLADTSKKITEMIDDVKEIKQQLNLY